MGSFTEGLNSFLKGLLWLAGHPLYFFILFFPMMLGLGGFFAALWYAWGYGTDWFIGLFSSLDQSLWWLSILFFFGKIFVFLILGAFLGPFCLLLTNVFSSPFFDYVSKAVEKDIKGQVIEISFWDSLKLFPEEVKKFLFVSFILFLSLWVPVLHFFSPFLGAFFLAWDAYDLPLVRKGFTLSKRLHVVRKNALSIFGLSLWFFIPGISFLIMPLAVVGGTLLALSHESQ